MAKSLIHVDVWLRDGREIRAVSENSFYIVSRQLKNDRFVEFKGMVIESALITFMHDITDFAAKAEQQQEDPGDDPEPLHKKTITRNCENGRSNRNPTARKLDNQLVEEILRLNIGPMPLHEIIAEMKTRGALHWNNNNGSGFVKMAIKEGRRIAKVERGIYCFDWEAGE